MILEDEVNFPVSISHPLPSPGMDEVLFCMTSAAVQQGCCAGWGHLHCWPATGCPVPRPPLLGLLPSSSCSCHRSTGRACPVLGQCLPSPSTPGSFPASAPTSPSKGIHGNTAGSDATHPYSRDTAAARGGWFILWISPTLEFALQYVFLDVLQLWWQHSTDLICC